MQRKLNKLTAQLSVLALPAGEPMYGPVSLLPSQTWHNRNVTNLDVYRLGKGSYFYRNNAFDGALLRRLCAEYPYLKASGDRWRLVMYVTGVHVRGCKTMRQLDVEAWDYDTIAGRIEALIQRLTRTEVVGVKVVNFEQLPLFEAA